MANSLDRWTAFARGCPLEWYDYFNVLDLVDTPDGVVVLLNRENPSPPGVGDETPPEGDLPILLKLARDGSLIWRVSLSALNPNLGPAFLRYHTKGVSLIRTHSEDGFLVVGTVNRQRTSIEKDEVRAFACRVDEGGVFRWFKTYNDADGHNANGVTIAPLAKGLYLMAAKSVHKRFGGPALVFVLDDDGNVVGQGTRYFGLSAAFPQRLRALPTYGAVLVGTTVVWESINDPYLSFGWLLRFSDTGALVHERAYRALPATPQYPYANVSFADVAEGQSSVMVVGRQMYAAVMDGGAYLSLDGIPGPEGKSGDLLAARLFGRQNELNCIAPRSPRGPGEGQFVVTAGIGLVGLDATQLACLSETGNVLWEKGYTSHEDGFVTTLHRVCWRSNGDVVAGGDNLRVPYLGGTSILGAGFLACSESTVNTQSKTDCSHETTTVQQPFTITPELGPFKSEPFKVDVQTWGAVYQPNGWVVKLCSPEAPMNRAARLGRPC